MDSLSSAQRVVTNCNSGNTAFCYILFNTIRSVKSLRRNFISNLVSLRTPLVILNILNCQYKPSLGTQTCVKFEGHYSLFKLLKHWDCIWIQLTNSDEKRFP